MAEVNQYQNLTTRAHEAIEHWDALPAWECHQELEKFPASQEVAALKRQLLVVGFPAVPAGVATNIFREHVLDFFRADVKIKERLSTRYIFVGYGEKEEERKRLQVAILQNQERLGAHTIGQWLRLFDQRFKPEDRKEDTPLKFLTQSNEVAKMSKIEQRILREVLETYNEYLALEVIDEFDIVTLMNRQRGSPARPKNFEKTEHGEPRATKALSNVPLLEALSKYHQIAQQQVTREKIKLKTQVEPVRPTLMNWLKYYRSELGIGHHDSVQRGEFLYRSENGRRLSDDERERLNLILKSIEEDFPIQIDTERSEIIFPEFSNQGPRGTERNTSKRPTQTFVPSRSPAVTLTHPEARQINPAEKSVTSALSFHQGGIQSKPLEPPKKPVALSKPREEKPLMPVSRFGFKETPEIKGMKPAPVWQASTQAVPANNITFTSPHVFPAERERRETWQKEGGIREKKRFVPPQETHERKFIPPQPTPRISTPPSAPPAAPKRSAELPRIQPQSAPNRFNITPMSYREKNDPNE